MKGGGKQYLVHLFIEHQPRCRSLEGEDTTIRSVVKPGKNKERVPVGQLAQQDSDRKRCAELLTREPEDAAVAVQAARSSGKVAECGHLIQRHAAQGAVTTAPP